MDHATIVEQLLDRCKRLIESMLQAPDLHSVASAALAIFVQMRQVARDILQAKMVLEAQQLRRQDVAPCGPEASMKYVHTRTVSPETLFGEITIPVRTFQCSGCGAPFRPDEAALGVPEVGTFTDDVRYLYAPVAAAWPHRVANALFAQGTGVGLSSRGAQGIIDSMAEDLRLWQAEHERQEAAVVARRYLCVLGAAEELAVRIRQVLREAGWERLPIGELVGDGTPWMWNVADAYLPGVRQTLDDDQLSEHLDTVAHRLYPNNPAGAKAWVDQKLGALLTDRVGEVLGALKRLRPWKKVVHDALAQLLGDVERTQTRIRYQEPWHRGLAVGAGAVEGACKHVIQSRFKRAGMHWKQPGVLNVLALRLARLNGTFQAFWASRGLAVQASG